MLIDTHAHINFNAYKEDGDEVIRRALAEDVWLINVGSQYKTSKRAIDYAQKYESGVFAAVGLHPTHLLSGETEVYADEFESVKFKNQAEEFDYEKYKALAQSDKVVAIGEIGLDYYHIADNRKQITEKQIEEVKNLQKQIFIKQMNLATEVGKPVMIHCREAHQDLLEILKQYCHPEPAVPGEGSITDSSVAGLPQNDKGIKGVIHSFSGSWSQAQEYLEMGFYLGFNGIITFARDYDRVVKEMPLSRLLIETDCPYLTPNPFRGKRNEPSYVKYVAQKVAELRSLSFEEVSEKTAKNAKELFQI
jgi:TatD DNase family protein